MKLPAVVDFSTNQEANMIKQFKIIVEKHPDGYVAYP